MKKIITLLLCVLCTSVLFAKIHPAVAEFRDTMYNDPLNTEMLNTMYEKTVSIVNEELEGYELYVELSRCEYYMGRSAFFCEDEDLAGDYYDKGIEYAEEALDIQEGADGYIMHAENISQNCAVKSTFYAMGNGLDVAKFAKKALKFDPNNAAALYMIEAQHIYAPSPFNNYKKGIANMTEILENPDLKYENDDIFNLTSSIALGHIEREEWEEALPWINQALEVYPTNFFALDLKNQILENK